MENISVRRKSVAWLVHLYTATGGVVGMSALFAVAGGQVRTAFLLLIVAFLIDGTDGILARRVGVSDVLPHFSGAEIDNIIDFLTYVWVPVFIMGSQHLLPDLLWLAVPVIAGLYAYGQTNMKTPDAFFLGFPSYWNIIALYLYLLHPEPIWAVALVVVPGVLTFIPTRYLYPSKNNFMWKTSWALGGVWFFILIDLLLQDTPNQTLVWLSLYYPVYYMIVSFYADWRIRHGDKLS